MWYQNARFYAIHPLNAFGAEEKNDFSSPANHRICELTKLTGVIKETGANALYLGPVFESSSHGYDTVDFFHIDRRLGNNESFRKTMDELHASGLKVIGDGVFNHVGRDFWAFFNLRQNKENSPYKDWFRNVNFSANNRFNDMFTYDGWEGHENLVALNRKNAAVKEHLFEAVRHMILDLGFDGLRLDVAYSLEKEFLAELKDFTRSLKSDFFLLGEIIHGDYRAMLEKGKLDSVTNYEIYKGLWSSHNDLNYYEIAWTLNREFGESGVFTELGTEFPPVYNFSDNHDVNRLFSVLKNKDHVFLVYALMYMIPGIPSIYYGSEYCTQGIRDQWSDSVLRPYWHDIDKTHKDLLHFIKALATIRQRLLFLAHGGYRQLHLSNTELAFSRFSGDRALIIALNIGPKLIHMNLQANDGTWADSFHPERILHAAHGKMNLTLAPVSVQIWEKK